MNSFIKVIGLLRRPYTLIAVALIAIMLPVFLVTTNVRTVTNSGWLYTYGFDRYGVAEDTGIEPRALRGVADEIKEYFRNEEELLAVRAVVFGQEKELFTEREILHMVDVKDLMGVVNVLQRTSFYTMFGLTLSLFALAGRRNDLAALGRGLNYGAVLSFVILVALGLGFLVGFEKVFTQFHHVSFANDLWLLNPHTDYLIMIFPEGFFRDATLIIAGLTMGEAALTWVLGYGLRRKMSSPPVTENGKRGQNGDS